MLVPQRPVQHTTCASGFVHTTHVHAQFLYFSGDTDFNGQCAPDGALQLPPIMHYSKTDRNVAQMLYLLTIPSCLR